MANYFPSYYQTLLTLSLMGPEISKAFPRKVSACVSKEQYDHAKLIAYLAQGIDAVSELRTLAVNIEKASQKIKEETKVLNLFKQRLQESNIPANEETAAAIKEAEDQLLKAQVDLEDLRGKHESIQKQEVALVKKQAEAWSAFEKEYADRMVAAVKNKGVEIDPNIVKSVIQTFEMLPEILERFKHAGFDIPKKLVDKKDVHARMQLKTRFALLKSIQGEVLDPAARDQRVKEVMS